MTSSSPIKVAVVGGGVIGVSTAQELARAGADVILLTESVLTSGASGRSLSWLNSAGMWREPYHRLRMAAIDRYRTLSARHPDLRWLRFAGGLAWYAADQGKELRRRHDHEVAHGYDSHLIGRDQVNALTPGVEGVSHTGHRCHLESGRGMGRSAEPRTVRDQGLRRTLVASRG